MPLESYDIFNVGKLTAKRIGASPTLQAKITLMTGGKLYYKVSSDVSTSDTEITSTITVEETVWVISAGESKILVEHLVGVAGQDLAVADDVTIGDTLKVTGITTPTGGIAAPSAIPGAYAGGWHPAAATSGTDTTPAEKKLFVTSLFLPVNKTVKGIGFLVGSVGGTNKAVAGLFDSAGTLLGHTSETTEGTLVGTAAEMQEIDLTATYAAKGPAVYFIGVTMNGNTARLRTIPKNTAGANVLSKEITIAAKNVLANITAPTAFEADKGMIGWVY